MRIIINKVYIQNFKIFKEIEILLDSPNLIIFDGPNGFGKTSFYDAIELLLTGQIRRYKKLSSTTIDNRESYTENPYLNNNSSQSELIIKAELLSGENKLCILRKYTDDKLPLKSLDDFKPKLYTSDSFESPDHHLVDNEQVFLNNLLGENYLNNFEFLNYVEQGDSTYILRAKDKDRKAAISHLFNTSSFDEQIDKLQESSRKIGSLCDKSSSAEIAVLEETLTHLKDQVLPEVTYERLLPDASPEWDIQEIEFNNNEYANWLSAVGDIELLKELTSNRPEFIQLLRNTKIKLLSEKKALIQKALLLKNHIHNYEALRSTHILATTLQNLLFSLDTGLLSAIEASALDISELTAPIFDQYIDVPSYQIALKSIKTLIANSDNLSKVLNQLKETRNSLVVQFQHYESITDKTSECPLCGYNWITSSELEMQISIQSQLLETVLTTNNDTLNVQLTVFDKAFIAPLSIGISEYVKLHSVDETLINTLQASVLEHSQINVVYEELSTFIQDINDYTSKNPTTKYEDKSVEIIDFLQKLISLPETPVIHDKHQQIFTILLKEKIETLYALNQDSINNKISYINWKYSLHQSAAYQATSEAIRTKQLIFDQASQLKKQLDTTKKVYEKSLKQYQTEIIQDIEILFHIYSARIVQDTQGGLGLFINPDKNGIRFLDNPSKQYDAAFSMSSGQLSSLVISFTLALNKRYSRNKLLLIDDPVQTMDDLNVAGLIDLLRQEFDDRQIFIATHEPMMSAYMRYKFIKHGLSTKQIDFKASIGN